MRHHVGLRLRRATESRSTRRCRQTCRRQERPQRLCQRFARNYAPRPHVTPRAAELDSTTDLRGYAGTRGGAERCEPSAHRW
jgi:hypothetical protein